jgi:hypothetical protein
VIIRIIPTIPKAAVPRSACPIDGNSSGTEARINELVIRNS